MPDAPRDAAYQLFVGVDIAAATATVAWQTPKQKPSKPLTIEQSQMVSASSISYMEKNLSSLESTNYSLLIIG